jgi:small subunit ribosomal protein S16
MRDRPPGERGSDLLTCRFPLKYSPRRSMVRIRLMRVGKRKQPSYRVVVADGRSPRDGRIIEAIGHYQPRQDPSEITIDEDRAVFWLERGAQPSNTVRNLLRITGAWSTFTGEAPPAGVTPAAAAAPKKATTAASVKATPAASVTEDALPDTDTEEALLDDQPPDAGPVADAAPDEPTE